MSSAQTHGSRDSDTRDSDTRDSGGWQPASTAPFDRDLELAVIEAAQIHALVFPCRRAPGGWMNTQTSEVITQLIPSHWRKWRQT